MAWRKELRESAMITAFPPCGGRWPEGPEGGKGRKEDGDKPSISLGTPDGVLKGGVALSELHEITPAGPWHHGAALGFALALAALAPSPQGAIVFVQQDFAALEGAAFYALGGAAFGIHSE